MSFERTTLEKTFKFHSVNSLCFSPDETKLCSVGNDKVILVDLSSGRKSSEFHDPGVWKCDYSQTGNLILTSSQKMENNIRLWNTQLESEDGSHTIMNEHSDWVFCIRFNHNGKKFVSGSCDKTIKFWDVEREKSVLTLESEWVYSVDVLHDDRTVISGHEGRECVRLWDLRIRKKVHTFLDKDWNKVYNSRVSCLKFHPRRTRARPNIFATGDFSGLTKIYDFRTYQLIQIHGNMLEFEYYVRDLSFHPNGKYLISGSDAYGGDESVRIIDILKEKVVFSQKTHSVSSVQFSPSGDYFATCNEFNDGETIHLWKTNMYDHRETQSKLDLEERITFLKENYKKYESGNHIISVKISSVLNEMEFFSIFFM